MREAIIYLDNNAKSLSIEGLLLFLPAMLEHYFDCPHCWESQLKMIDPSVGFQEFIEDCEVCCNPIQFQIGISYNEVSSFSAEPIGQ